MGNLKDKLKKYIYPTNRVSSSRFYELLDFLFDSLDTSYKRIRVLDQMNDPESILDDDNKLGLEVVSLYANKFGFRVFNNDITDVRIIKQQLRENNRLQSNFPSPSAISNQIKLSTNGDSADIQAIFINEYNSRNYTRLKLDDVNRIIPIFFTETDNNPPSLDTEFEEWYFGSANVGSSDVILTSVSSKRIVLPDENDSDATTDFDITFSTKVNSTDRFIIGPVINSTTPDLVVSSITLLSDTEVLEYDTDNPPTEIKWMLSDSLEVNGESTEIVYENSSTRSENSNVKFRIMFRRR